MSTVQVVADPEDFIDYWLVRRWKQKPLVFNCRERAELEARHGETIYHIRHPFGTLLHLKEGSCESFQA